MAENLYTHKDSNIRKTWLLMTGFFLFVIAIGWLFARVEGNPVILYAAIVLSLVMNVVSYWNSDTIALAMSGARPLARQGNERLFRIIENLSITAGLPMPRIHIIPGGQINAFATGRNPEHAAVAVTEGALAKLNDNELEGVLAHELSHIGNRDILVSSVVVVLAGIIAIMADWFLRISMFGGRRRDDNGKAGGLLVLLAVVAALLAPLAATLIQLAVSRKREFLADSSGALLTRYPEGLASALEKIAMDETPLRTAHSSTAHLFLSNPFKARDGHNWFTRLFLTHPPIKERIRILRNIK